MSIDSKLSEVDRLYHEHKEKLTDAEKKIKAETEKLRELIKENPMSAVVIAGVVGYLLGRLFGRRG